MHEVETDGGAANATGVGVRHGALHVSGTGARPDSGRALRYLEPGRSALRDGWRDRAVPGRDAERLHRLHPENGATTFIRQSCRMFRSNSNPFCKRLCAKTGMSVTRRSRRCSPTSAISRGELEAEGSSPQIKAPAESGVSKIKRHKRVAFFTLAAAILAAAAFAYSIFFVAPAPSPNEKSIAVLPFENLSEEKSNAYFADGIQDEILTRLSKIADLKVISRTSTQRYKNTSQHLSEIAQPARRRQSPGR